MIRRRITPTDHYFFYNYNVVKILLKYLYLFYTQIFQHLKQLIELPR